MLGSGSYAQTQRVRAGGGQGPVEPALRIAEGEMEGRLIVLKILKLDRPCTFLTLPPGTYLVSKACMGTDWPLPYHEEICRRAPRVAWKRRPAFKPYKYCDA